MFNRAVLELYDLRDRHKEDQETVESIDRIIAELTNGISAVLDMINDKGHKLKDHLN